MGSFPHFSRADDTPRATILFCNLHDRLSAGAAKSTKKSVTIYNLLISTGRQSEAARGFHCFSFDSCSLNDVLTAKKSPGKRDASLFWNSFRPSSTSLGQPLTMTTPRLWSTSKLAAPAAIVYNASVFA